MTDTATVDAAELLERAADRIERHGLARGIYRLGDKCCMVGALAAEQILGARSRT